MITSELSEKLLNLLGNFKHWNLVDYTLTEENTEKRIYKHLSGILVCFIRDKNSYPVKKDQISFVFKDFSIQEDEISSSDYYDLYTAFVRMMREHKDNQQKEENQRKNQTFLSVIQEFENQLQNKT